jgi:hypothetical protein
MMKKCFQAHNARLIVNKNLDHGNTCIIWNLICKAYDSSMTAELKSQQILTWLAQTQLHTNNWSGTQESFLTFYQDQVCLHNEINKKYPLPNNQACNFLQAAVSRMPNLASVYQTWNINNQGNAEPSDRELQFLEYIQLLILNAQVYNAGRKNHSKSSKLDVNLMDLAFDEIETDEMVHKINEHDIDPTYGQLEVNVNDTKCSSTRSSAITKTGPRKVFVDCDTWRSLSQANQSAWDKLMDGAKTKIVGYGIKKGKQLAIESQSTEKHSVHFHDVEFDDDISDSKKEPAALKVGTHMRSNWRLHAHAARSKKKTSSLMQRTVHCQ